jgi:hypothetical protein
MLYLHCVIFFYIFQELAGSRPGVPQFGRPGGRRKPADIRRTTAAAAAIQRRRDRSDRGSG